MKSRILIMTGVLTTLFLSFVLLTSLIYAQASAGWTTYTSDKCQISFSYPSDWKVSEKTEDRFDEDQVVEVSVKSIKSKDNMPAFTISSCDIGESTSSDFESHLDTFYSLMKLVPNFDFIEDTHLAPKVLSNSTIDAYVTTFKGKLKYSVGFEYYDLLHNEMMYSFVYSDLTSHFDSPESKQIRSKILQSINFIK